MISHLPEKSDVAADAGAPIDIVVVEDEPTLARNLARFLTRRGYRVTVAGTIARARELCRARAPDIVLTDYNLPDGNGLTLTDELRAAGFACKVVLITAHGNAALADDALRRGADRYLQKPVPFETLASIVGELEPTP
jgi:DNA-binding NtrC family response regulator